MQTPHARAKQAKHVVADVIEQALKITFPTQDGPTRVTRDGDNFIRVRHADLGGGPVYTAIKITAEA